MASLAISEEAARRFLLDHLWLGSGRPPESTVIDLVQHLEAVQIDPVARVGRNQDLVLMTRNTRYQPTWLDDALMRGDVFEYRAQEASVLPMKDYPLLKGVRQRMRERLQDELDRYADIVQEIVARIEAEGPLMARDFASDHRVLGYWDTDQAQTKATSHVLNLLYDAGYLVIASRQGVIRRFDIPHRRVPRATLEEAEAIDVEDADRRLFEKYFRAYGLVNASSPRLGWSYRPMRWRRAWIQEQEAQGKILRVDIKNVKRPYYVLEAYRDRLIHWENAERGWNRPIRFLPPLDNLLWDRDRLSDLFSFYYRWEVYVPAHRRTFGVYAMPVLAGDRLIGRIDPELHRRTHTLRLHKIEFEPGIRVTPRLKDAVADALCRFGDRLGAHQLAWDPSLDADDSHPENPDQQ